MSVYIDDEGTPYTGGEEFNEYNDPDATACANGDYNTWEENQVFGEE
jgi:hypothetical protein